MTRSRPARRLPAWVLVLAAGCGPTTAPPQSPKPPGPSAAAEPDGTRQRNIVRKKLPRDTASIALEYTVVLVDDAGARRPVDPVEHTFAVGDSFLVQIRPQDELYVYVFNEGPGGARTCLLPAEDEPQQRVRAGAEITLPDDGTCFTFEPPAGEEKLVVVALPEPTDDVRRLAASVFEGAAGSLRSEESRQQADAALETLRRQSGAEVRTRGPVRKLVERVEAGIAPGSTLSHVEPPGDGETSSYAVAVAGVGGSPSLVLDIPLKSRAAPAADGN